MSLVCPHCAELHADEVVFCPKTGKAISVSKISEGTVIDEKYRVVRRVASGGMGAVYEVMHERIRRRLAMKLILPELAQNADMTARFEREARAASAIGHENIVEITDMGTTEEGLPFLVMEFLEGCDLSVLLDAGKVSEERARHIVAQILAALEAAHSHKIIHRDLKPENVFLIRRGEDPDFVKLLDFGISKIADSDEAKLRLTSTGLILGTPFYMSPEQARGEREIDHRSDLFAVGSILYQATTGERPFKADNLNQLLFQIVNGKYQRARRINPDLSEGIDRVIQKALAVDPERRFQDAAAFRNALLGKRLLSVSELPVRAPTASTGKVDAFSPTLSADSKQLESTGTPMAWSSSGSVPAPRRMRWLWAAGGLGVAAIAIVLAVVFGTAEQKKRSSATPGGSMAAMGMASMSPIDTGRVRIGVRTEPPGARVLIDGSPVAEMPIRLTRGRQFKLTVSALGYQPKQLDLVARSDQELVVSLNRLDAPVMAPPSVPPLPVTRRVRPGAKPPARRRIAPRARPRARRRARPRPRPMGMRRIRAITDI